MNDTPTNWRHISVFLDDTPQSGKIGTEAAILAQRFKAHLIGIHSIAGSPGEYAADCFALGKKAIDNIIQRRRAAEEEQALAVGRRFAALSAKYDISTEFRVIWSGRAEEEALVNSLHCDLVILGHPKPYGLPESWTAERLLIASGVPMLMIPAEWQGETLGNRVLVAWNASREARRAIADAMPLLRTAQSVTVLVVDAAKEPDKFGDEPGSDIATYLSRHGVHVEVERKDSHGKPVATIIEAEAKARQADLVVIGAYSHARSAEILFGGVTRAMLTRMPVPVLVSR
ncbi:universal stress protein [Telmatospirillum siberiense]|uniref:Universal stress protein UspA n=1 Tax=Telmatospirillum siberiense TaxID=382514 RepID=A0A2N3PZB2_9PROT|nr:universal stress protein [Telmatospirillum siberiense]PKU25701.1 universal stress protein UspA [Telmatospirillum siberiense]